MKLTSYPGTVRQLIVTGLGRDAPTVIITNDNQITTRALIGHYARRMTIEQRLAEIIQAFCADALSSAVNLNVDLDVVLCVLAQALTAAFRLRLPGNYAHATPDTLQRRFLDTPGEISQHRHRHHRQDQPPRLLTRPPRSRPARRHHRPLVGRTPGSTSNSPDPRVEVPVRKSALAHLASASWTAGSSRSRTPLRSLTRRPIRS